MLLLPNLVITDTRMLGISSRELKLLVCTNSPSPTPPPSGPFRTLPDLCTCWSRRPVHFTLLWSQSHSSQPRAKLNPASSPHNTIKQTWMFNLSLPRSARDLPTLELSPPTPLAEEKKLLNSQHQVLYPGMCCFQHASDHFLSLPCPFQFRKPTKHFAFLGSTSHQAC
jgi:hypothetical protein